MASRSRHGTGGYASSFDQHRAWYHPQIKIPVGERIASWALATQYGNDTWSLADMYEIYIGKKSAAPGILNGGEIRELGNALKAEDLKRRIEAARELLKVNNIGNHH